MGGAATAVMVVVTRWYGGTKLGAGGLVRAPRRLRGSACSTSRARSRLVARRTVRVVCPLRRWRPPVRGWRDSRQRAARGAFDAGGATLELELTAATGRGARSGWRTSVRGRATPQDVDADTVVEWTASATIAGLRAPVWAAPSSRPRAAGATWNIRVAALAADAPAAENRHVRTLLRRAAPCARKTLSALAWSCLTRPYRALLLGWLAPGVSRAPLSLPLAVRHYVIDRGFARGCGQHQCQLPRPVWSPW